MTSGMTSGIGGRLDMLQSIVFMLIATFMHIDGHESKLYLGFLLYFHKSQSYTLLQLHIELQNV